MSALAAPLAWAAACNTTVCLPRLRPSMGTFPWHGQLSTSLHDVSLGALGGFSLHEAPPGNGQLSASLRDLVWGPKRLRPGDMALPTAGLGQGLTQGGFQAAPGRWRAQRKARRAATKLVQAMASHDPKRSLRLRQGGGSERMGQLKRGIASRQGSRLQTCGLGFQA